MDEITSLISNVGFPIVACCFMFTQTTKMQQVLSELTVAIKSIDIKLSTKDKEGV